LEKTGAFKKIVRTKIGSPFVVEAMQQALQRGFQRVVGCEANGGFLTATDCELNGRTLTALPTRDAAIVHLSLLGLARKRNVPLSQLTKDLPQRFVVSGRLQNFPPELAQQKLTELERNSVSSAIFGELQSVDCTDGVRMTFADDIVHIRASGNAPELRCYVEAATEEHAAELLKQGLAILTDWQNCDL
jgi:phosphomannomutase